MQRRSIPLTPTAIGIHLENESVARSPRWTRFSGASSRYGRKKPTFGLAAAIIASCAAAWSAAKVELAKAIDPPTVQDNSFEYAALLLLLDDSKGYQEFCRKLAASAGEPASGEAAFIMARTMAISAAEVVEPQRVVAWAERAVKDDSRPWQLHVLGLALFCAGQFDLAMSRLEKSNSGQWATSSKAQNWLVQAMIESRRGHGEEARRLIDRARQAIREVEPKKPNEPVRANVGPTDWVELAVLLREAEAMIEPTGTSKDGSAVSAAAR